MNLTLSFHKLNLIIFADMLLSIDVIQTISIILVLMLFFIGFKLVETKWSYKISKPFLWEKSVKENLVSGKLKRIERAYRDKVRFYTIWLQINRLRSENINGAFAELGVYKGETAQMIHEMDPERKLYLFDTFQGFNNEDLLHENSNDEKFNTDNFADTSLETVKKFVSGNDNVMYMPGYFPESAIHLNEQHFAFVHLDADLYKPTLAALNFFYPRLSAGGVILIHDYNHTWPGLRKAVDEFLTTIPESPLWISDWQGSIMIIKNHS
jgi:O-methyltransferase